MVEKRRKEEIDKLQDELTYAIDKKDYNLVQLVEFKKKSLENANIWLNGNARAKTYLTIVFALAAGALAPPLVAIIVAFGVSDGLARYFKFIFQKPAK